MHDWRRWVELACGGQLRRCRRMRGGVSSMVHDVTLSMPTGELRHVVLRRYEGHEARDAATLVLREAHALRTLERHRVPDAPRLIAIDDTGALAGRPAMIMSLVAGRPILDPPDPSAWAAHLAEHLAHQLEQLEQVPPNELPTTRLGWPARR